MAAGNSSSNCVVSEGGPEFVATRSIPVAKTVPQAYMARPAMAGLPSRLVHRFEVLNEPKNPSAAAASVAAAGPFMSRIRKMKISAPVIDILPPGMRCGNAAISPAMATPR